ncbi:MFS transporter [Arhodomonas sp. AD133]|uniref:MFS transporter n=1 Tax=Arhodomonas sp. AD133 TaxID=3415009 RepID=UPI003EBE500D
MTIASTGLAGHWVTLALAQVIAGLGAGLMLPAIYSLAAFIAPTGRESAVLGRVITGWSLAMVAAVPASAFVADRWGWRTAFFIVAGLGGCALLGFRRLPELKPRSGRPGGSLRGALAIQDASLTLGVCFLYMVSFYGVYTFLGAFVESRPGGSASLAGMAVLAYGCGFGAGSLAGTLIDRVSARIAARYILMAISCVYLLLSAVSTASFATIVPTCFLWGSVNHLGLNSLVSVLSQLDEEGRVRLMGLFSAVSYGGMMVAGISFGFLYETLGFAALPMSAAILCGISAVLARVCLSQRGTCPQRHEAY